MAKALTLVRGPFWSGCQFGRAGGTRRTSGARRARTPSRHSPGHRSDDSMDSIERRARHLCRRRSAGPVFVSARRVFCFPPRRCDADPMRRHHISCAELHSVTLAIYQQLLSSVQKVCLGGGGGSARFRSREPARVIAATATGGLQRGCHTSGRGG